MTKPYLSNDLVKIASRERQSSPAILKTKPQFGLGIISLFSALLCTTPIPSWWQNRTRGLWVSCYAVSPFYDLVFFILAPLFALVLGLSLANSPLNSGKVFNGENWVELFISVFIMAHLFIVIFRSHCDQKVFRLYPYHFTLVPIVVFLVFGLTTWALVIGSVLATFWDVYHSSLQTFGLGRIYDQKAENNPLVGRRLDFILNLFLYAGPIAAGATLMDHINDFSEFQLVESVFFTRIPAHVENISGYISWLVIGTGIPFLFYYVYSYRKLSRLGYKVSYQKVTLLVLTGLCSIYAWGFNTFGMAFFIMNFFHAWQYFAIIWWAEKKNMVRIMRLEKNSHATLLTLIVFLSIAFGYGVFVVFYDSDGNAWLEGAILVVALMHFWYDGFIWSMRKKQV